MTRAAADNDGPCPTLPLAAWDETRATLHLWTQVVGKVRLALTPPEKHWWHVPLYVTARGLTTGPMPHSTGRVFQVEFDFLAHRLAITCADGAAEGFALAPMSVADFHRELMGRLDALGLGVRIWTTPVELPNPVPFEADHAHAAYDAAWANRFWRVLLGADRVLHVFRGRFRGKASPVHFFWGSFDLAASRFSGRPPRRIRACRTSRTM